MGYFQVRYDSRVVNYDRKLFIRLATEIMARKNAYHSLNIMIKKNNCRERHSDYFRIKNEAPSISQKVTSRI